MNRQFKVGMRSACAVAAIVLFWLPVAAHAQKLVFVVRHAERADSAMTQMQGKADPPLSARGKARAVKLAAMLADAGISAIYVTEYLRTKQTAQPLADKLHVAPRQYADADALVKELHSAHANDIVLVVGHSNTVPGIIKALGGSEVKLEESDYDNLFIVVPAAGTTTRIRFTP